MTLLCFYLEILALQYPFLRISLPPTMQIPPLRASLISPLATEFLATEKLAGQDNTHTETHKPTQTQVLSLLW